MGKPMTGVPMYQPKVDFEEVDRTWWPKNILYKHYIVLKPMTFKTKIVMYEAKITRKSDGAVLARLSKDGTLIVYPGYYWDGPSGPTIDTLAFILASLPHDIFYQMLREDLLIKLMSNCAYYKEEFDKLRKWADDTMRMHNKYFGMSSFRAYYTYKAVRTFGESSAISERYKEYCDFKNHT